MLVNKLQVGVIISHPNLFMISFLFYCLFQLHWENLMCIWYMYQKKIMCEKDTCQKALALTFREKCSESNEKNNHIGWYSRKVTNFS